jgi:DNA-binding SARP family transcriptional activator
LYDGRIEIFFRLFGPLELWIGGHSHQLGPPKHRAVLGLLVLAAGQVVPQDRFVDEMWGDDPPVSAIPTLQAYLSRLRTGMADACHRSGSANTPLQLIRRSPGYALRRPRGSLDVERFESLVTMARACLDDAPASARSHLDEAMALVAGPPLADIAGLLGPSAAAEAWRIGELVVHAQETRVEAMLQMGDVGDAVRETAALTHEHPLREHLHALRMLALYRGGRQGEALDVYEHARRHLQEELGVDPGAELSLMRSRILRHDPALSPVTAAAVGRAPGRAPETRRPATDFDAVFDVMVGRDHQLGLLSGALERSREGKGSVWLISGEAGIGKSRLCREVGRYAARDGMDVCWGRAHETAGGAPFWPWVEALDGLPRIADEEIGILLGRTEAADGMHPATARMRAYDATVRMLSARARVTPLLLVLEDLQWADEPTLELLSLLGRRSGDTGLVVLATYRTEESRAPSALARSVADLLREPHVERVELPGLNADAVATLLRGRLGIDPSAELVSHALDRCDGNPFFLTELARLAEGRQDDLRSAWSAVPRTIRDVLLYRVSGLPEQTRSVLDLAAVIGRESELDLLAASTAWDLEALDQSLAPAVRAGLIVERPFPRPGIRFRHALVRETLYDELRPIPRARLHAVVGTSLLSTADASTIEMADGVAFHLTEGVDIVGVPAVLPALLAAAQQAIKRLAYEHAIQLLDQGVFLLNKMPPGPERTAAEISLQSRRGMLFAARYGYAAHQTLTALGRVHELAVASDLDGRTFTALSSLAAAFCIAAQLPAARAIANEFLDHAQRGGDAGAQWEMIGRWISGTADWLSGDLEPARSSLTAALQIAERGAAGPAYEQSPSPDIDPPQRRRPGDLEDMTLWEEPALDIRCFLACVLMLVGRPADAYVQLDETIRTARRLRKPFLLCRALTFLAVAATTNGDLRRAGESAAEAIRLGDTYGTPMWSAAASAVHGWIAARGGSPDGAATVREATRAYAATGARMWQTLHLGLLADAELAEGNAERALRAAEDGLAEADATGERFWIAQLCELRERARSAGTAVRGAQGMASMAAQKDDGTAPGERL